MDIRVYDLARALLDEFTAALIHTRAGAAEVAVIHPGDQVPQYGCALAAVRLVTILPAEMRGPVCPPEWQATFELTMDRCYRTPEDNGMPALGVLDSAVRDLLEDAGAMRKAALCAWGNNVRRRFATWTPRGASGAIHGGAMQVTALGLSLTCGCDDETWGNGIDSRIPMLDGDPRNTVTP